MVDTDFPMLIAPRRATGPSIVLLRGVNELPPDQHARWSSRTCPLAEDLRRGAIVSLGRDHLRVRAGSDLLDNGHSAT